MSQIQESGPEWLIGFLRSHSKRLGSASIQTQSFEHHDCNCPFTLLDDKLQEARYHGHLVYPLSPLSIPDTQTLDGKGNDITTIY